MWFFLVVRTKSQYLPDVLVDIIASLINALIDDCAKIRCYDIINGLSKWTMGFSCYQLILSYLALFCI